MTELIDVPANIGLTNLGNVRSFDRSRSRLGTLTGAYSELGVSDRRNVFRVLRRPRQESDII